MKYMIVYNKGICLHIVLKVIMVFKTVILAFSKVFRNCNIFSFIIIKKGSVFVEKVFSGSFS